MIWLLSLFYITLFVGMTPMDAAASLLSLFVIFDLGKKYSQKGFLPLYRVGFDLVFVLWIGAIVLSYTVNGVWDDSSLKYLIELKWIPFLYFLIYAVVRARLDEKIVIWASLPAIAAAVYAIVISFLGVDLIKNEDLEKVIGTDFWRTGGLYSDSMTMAHSYGMIFCLLAGLFLSFYQYRGNKKYFLFFASSLMALAILLTFTRGIWLGLVVALIIMAFLVSRLLAFLFALGGTGLAFLLYEFWPVFRERIEQSLTSKGYDDERLWIWKANWSIFKEHPIFGVGYGENRRLLPEYFEKVGAPLGTKVSHAHNQFLHIASGIGLLGLLAYLLMSLFFLSLTVRCWRQISGKYQFQRGLCLGLLGAQITFLVGGLTEANFESAKVKYVLVLVWSLVVWLAYEIGILKTPVRA